MKEVNSRITDNKICLKLSGHIDSGNASEIKKEIFEAADQLPEAPVEIDAEELTYISSAGLRVLLQLRKTHQDMRITDVGPEVYEILDMTGFTQMMKVEKAYRQVSIEGCEIIGKGANGTIYRIDKDNVVKVYKHADALEEIHNEREMARLALVLGIPTAISYDVVKVGDSYGSVFELLNARSFAEIMAKEPERLDWCVNEYVRLLKKIHDTEVPEGKLPDMKETALSWARFMQDYLPGEAGEKLLALVEDIPADDHMLHGDYHTKNIEQTDDEILLIDMDTLAAGHPVFELASMYNAFIGFSEYDHENVRDFLGFDFELSKKFWRRALAEYLGTEYEPWIREVENKARILGYTRLIRRSIRRGGLESERESKEIDLWKKNLLELLETTDSLVFSRDEIKVDATVENLPVVTDFVERKLENSGVSLTELIQIGVAVEEIFVNIAHYAYTPGTGKAVVQVKAPDGNDPAVITFTDWGTPYDPLAQEDPDVTLSAEEREVGGLGIFMVKRSVDEISYEYRDNMNILTLKKKLKR